ncbi:MAG: branched-chain amino acid aminotransferase [Candidatus Marinimicrobia bacterium]|nr:branched-chain amino acid aminotransferase [Candidatus Neomarinimicrobiota bacterium]
MDVAMKDKVAINWDKLTFSITPTRSMYQAKCEIGKQWQSGKLIPYGDITLSPAAGVLNYGQGIFEGMKAFRTVKGNIGVFRPLENAKRINQGCYRLCMPEIPEEMFMDAIIKVVRDNEDYIPPMGKGALYIRPIVWGTGPVLGVAPAPEYTFMIYVSPVGSYFKGALSGINLKVMENYHRAPQFGTGCVKAVGNYAASMRPAKFVKSEGFSEVVYLDAREEKYLEEVGSANLFMIKGDTLITPELTGSILPGITRKSIVQLAVEEFDFTAEERKIAVEEIFEADEMFCSGTATVITPINSITYRDEKVVFSGGNVGEKTIKLYERLTSIQNETGEDSHGWLKII